MNNFKLLKPVKIILMTGILWVGFSASPDTNGFPQFGTDAVAGNGNGNGNGNGGRDNNSGRDASANATGQKEDNLHSDLGALNSLSRNIQGLINGKDEKLDGYRVRDPETGLVTGATNPENQDWSEAVSSWIEGRVKSFNEAFKSLNEPETFEPDSE